MSIYVHIIVKTAAALSSVNNVRIL